MAIAGDPLSYRVGDRVTLTLPEYPTSFPVEATVTKIWLKFPKFPPLREVMIHIELDEHPFPEVLAAKLGLGPMTELTMSVRTAGLITPTIASAPNPESPQP